MHWNFMPEFPVSQLVIIRILEISVPLINVHVAYTARFLYKNAKETRFEIVE